MRKITLSLLGLALAAAIPLGCGSSDSGSSDSTTRIVVANRDEGTLSIIDDAQLAVVDTIPLPAGTNPAKPGYVAYSETRDRLYVGDEANQRIVVLSGTDYGHVTDLPAVSDVFHLWHNDSQLWAVDRANTSVAVFDLETNTRLMVIPIPTDLTSQGGVPHDVVVDANHAFVSVLGIENAADVVLRFSTSTLAETGRFPVGEDPHLFLHPTTPRLYVACQDSDAVYVVDRDTLALEDVIPVDGGHGVWIPAHGERLYVTNFAGHVVGTPNVAGAFALFTIDVAGGRVVDSTHAPASAPHNLASNLDGTQIYMTHSNGETDVSVYSAAGPSSPPRLRRVIRVGANPFGICRIR